MAYHRGSVFGAIVLIGLGVLFLYSNSHPEVDVWYIFAHYWPALLILSGVAKLWDYYATHKNPNANWSFITAGEIGSIAIAVFLIVLIAHHHHGPRGTAHQHQTVDYGSAKSVNAYIQMPEGDLEVSDGASQLVDSDLNYGQSADRPTFSYDVQDGEGELNIKQEEHSHMGFHPGFGEPNNKWNIRFGKNVPLELKVEVGAGRTNLQLGNLPLTKLDVQMGAGSVTADLRGNWKNDLDAHIQGGVGGATIYLPKNVGVEIHAQGGIGSINANGMEKDGDRYINEAYGKSPNTLELHIEGGVGSINLIPEM